MHLDNAPNSFLSRILTSCSKKVNEKFFKSTRRYTISAKQNSSVNMAASRKRNVPEDGGIDVETDDYASKESSNDSTMRRLFNYYKKNDPPPDLSKVINMKMPNGMPNIHCVPFSSWKNNGDIEDFSQYTDLGLR